MKRHTTKAHKIFHVSACVLVLEIRQGHLAWKVTELVRKSGVSRALIYRYFGGNKEKILKQALSIFVEQMYGFEAGVEKLSFVSMVGRARQYVIDYPETVHFYQKVRKGNSDFSNVFISTEARFRERLTRRFPQLSPVQILLVHSCIHGMVTSPFLSSEDSTRICELFLQGGIFSEEQGQASGQ